MKLIEWLYPELRELREQSERQMRWLHEYWKREVEKYEARYEGG